MKILFEGKKLYVVVFVFVFIIIFFITFYIIRHHYNLVLKDTVKENKLTANLLSALICEHQKATISILESYTQRPPFIDAVMKKDVNNATPHLQSLREHYTEIDALFLTDRHGIFWANYPVDSSGFGKNLAYRDWYKEVSKDWKPYISSIYRLIVLDKSLAVCVSIPVFDGKGNVIGILSGAQRTAFLAAFIKANVLGAEKSITLLDQEGNIIFSTVVPYAEKITKYPVAQILEKAAAGVTADMEITDAKEKGGTSYVSIAPVRGLGWSVIVGQKKDIILKSLYGYFILTAVTGFVTFLFLTVGLFYFRRKYTYKKTKELQASEEKYRNLFDNAVEGVYLSTPEGRLISVNLAFARMFGYESPEEAIKTVTDAAGQMYVNPDDRKRAVGIFMETGYLKNFEGRMLRKDGSIFWARNDGRFTKTPDGIPCFEGFLIDITDRKRVEDALRESEKHYRTLFGNMLNGFAYCRMLFDGDRPLDFIYLEVNNAFETLTGLKNVVGKKASEAIPGIQESDTELFEIYGRVALTGKPKQFEKYVKALQMWFSISVYSLEKEHFVAVFDVITDRKEAEEKINKLNAELEQRVIERTTQLESANKELEAFSYSVSHDLRAPLRAIDGFSSIIMEEYREKLDAEGIRLLNVIGTNAKHMDQLITDLLALSKVTKSELKLSRIDMATLAHSIYHEIASPEVQQKFAFAVAPLSDSYGDPVLLRQVWSNLLSNAVKFTLPRDERRIEISGHTEKGINIYSIKDTGIGFNPNYTHKLFGVFQRLHKSSEFEGNGVGLAIVQRIIHRHGGRVWAEGKINEGAVFFFSLPIKEVKDESHE